MSSDKKKRKKKQRKTEKTWKEIIAMKVRLQ